MTEGKKTARITAAQVDTKVDALAAQVEELSEGIGSIVEMLTEQRAAQLLSQVKANPVEEAPKKRRPVGQRDGDVIVRNLHTNTMRVRIGKETDPYRINLEPRGTKGDTMAVPASLRSDLGYKNNLGVAFEEITEQEYDAIRTRKRSRRVDPETEKARSRTVTTDEQSTVSRKRDVTPEDRLSRIGPQYIDVPGSNNPSNFVNEGELSGVDAESDPEYREFLRFKAQRRAERESPDFRDARVSGRDPIENALRSGEQEAVAMARKIRNMEGGGRAGPSETGVIPKGELSKPVRVERSTVSVQPHNPSGL